MLLTYIEVAAEHEAFQASTDLFGPGSFACNLYSVDAGDEAQVVEDAPGPSDGDRNCPSLAACP